MSNTNIIGIDLGTTMSAIAKLNQVGEPEIIPNKDGDRIMPSVINFSKNSVLVGKEAKNSAPEDPERVAKEFKREMHNPDYRFTVDSKDYTAYELSSFILKKLAQDAAQDIGEIKKVVISVPAYFKENQRNATMEAGKLAGLDVIGIINEPTAAAIYYAKKSDIKGKGLVYDLGGGTFDVTVTKTDGQDVQILASEGDHHLGGVDFDKAILEIMEEKYKSETGGILYGDEGSRQEFLLLAEEIKKGLSKKEVVKKKLRGENGNVLVEISQSEFEEKISIFISKTELLVEQVMDEANMEAKDFDYILLVGGSTRIPAIKKSIKNLMGKEPLDAVNVDEAVALGAALKAGLVMLKDSPNEVAPAIKNNIDGIMVQDVANHSYGAIVLNFDTRLDKYVDTNAIIITKNLPLPNISTDTFFTTSEGQEKVSIKITQGEGEDPDFVDKIDEIVLSLPGGRPASQPLEVTYSYDENQIMHCKVTDVNSGRSEEKKLNLAKEGSSTNPLEAFIVN